MRPPSISFERSWQLGEVPENWRKANITPFLKKGKKEGAGHYGFIKENSCLANLITFLVEITALVDGWRAVAVVCLNKVRYLISPIRYS